MPAVRQKKSLKGDHLVETQKSGQVSAPFFCDKQHLSSISRRGIMSGSEEKVHGRGCVDTGGGGDLLGGGTANFVLIRVSFLLIKGHGSDFASDSIFHGLSGFDRRRQRKILNNERSAEAAIMDSLKVHRAIGACACVCGCVRAWVSARARACMRACVRGSLKGTTKKREQKSLLHEKSTKFFAVIDISRFFPSFWDSPPPLSCLPSSPPGGQTKPEQLEIKIPDHFAGSVKIFQFLLLLPKTQNAEFGRKLDAHSLLICLGRRRECFSSLLA